MKRFLFIQIPSNVLVLIYFFVSASIVTAAEYQKIMNFSGQWPWQPTRAVAEDHNRNLLMVAKGDRIVVLDATTLEFAGMYMVDQEGEAAALHYDEDNKRLYAACKAGGLQIIDVQDPANPVLLAKYQPDSASTIDITGVCISGQWAYIVGRMVYPVDDQNEEVYNLEIIDISNPEEPAVTQQVKLPGAYFYLTYCVDVVESSGFVYVADVINGVHIIDMNGEQAVPLKLMADLVGVRHIMIRDERLYAAAEASGILIVDISDPNNPTLLGQYIQQDEETQEITPVRTVDINPDTTVAYLAEASNGLEIIDISDPTDPKAFHPVHTYTDTGARTVFSIDASTIVITDYKKGFQVQRLNITDSPFSATMTASFDMPADVTGIHVPENHGYAYVIDDNMGNDPDKEGLRIFQITTGNNNIILLYEQGFIETPGTDTDVYADITKNIAYITTNEGIFSLVDISDPQNPSLNTIDLHKKSNAVYPFGDNAYVGCDDSIIIVNAADPSNPAILNTIETTGEVSDIKVIYRDEHIYAISAQKAGRIEIFDVTDTDNPSKKASIETPGPANALDIKTERIYVACGASGLEIIDISDIENPVETSVTSLDGKTAVSVSVAGSMAYMSCGDDGIMTIDATDPVNPQVVPEWYYDTAGGNLECSIFFSGENVFLLIADTGAGITILSPVIEEVPDYTTTSGSGGGCFLGTFF